MRTHLNAFCRSLHLNALSGEHLWLLLNGDRLPELIDLQRRLSELILDTRMYRSVNNAVHGKPTYVDDDLIGSVCRLADFRSRRHSSEAAEDVLETTDRIKEIR